MAENKKTIVIYSDWDAVFNQLEDHEAGKLIKHFFDYINDRNPTLEDRLLKIAFEPMRMQLKRDLTKWEETKKKRAEAGKKGGLKSAEARGIEANEANASSSKQKQANQADNDNVNDSDNVINKEDISIVGLPASTTTMGVFFQENQTDAKESAQTTTANTESLTKRADLFVDFFNKTKLQSSGSMGKFKRTDSVLKKFKARMKQYSPEEIAEATKKSFQHQLHIDQNFQYLTPEYILREDILERYVNMSKESLKAGIENRNQTSTTNAGTVYTPPPKPIDHSKRG